MFNTVEELPTTKSGRTFAVVGIAIAVVLVAIAAYVMLNRVTPTAEGNIAHISLYQPLPAQMADGSTPPGNGLIMLAPVTVRNLSSKSLAIMDLAAVVRVGDTDYKGYAATEADFDKVFRYYPDLEAYRKPILLRHSNIPPGGETQGLVIFNFALTENQWDHASAFFIDTTFDTTPYVLRLTLPTFPAHETIPAVQAPVIPQAPPEKPPSAANP
jgi:hypothetical protein